MHKTEIIRTDLDRLGLQDALSADEVKSLQNPFDREIKPTDSRIVFALDSAFNLPRKQ